MIHNKYFEIMKQFIRGYDKDIHGRGIEKKVGISQKNIALTLDKMEKEGILTSRKIGNIKYYSLNKLNRLIKNFILLAEIENSIEFFKKHVKIAEIFKKADISGAIICIFGSYAKGIEKKDSDLDLFIIGRINEHEIKEIGETYGVKLSIKKGTERDFVELLERKNPLINEILENHVIVTGFENFVREVIRVKW